MSRALLILASILISLLLAVGPSPASLQQETPRLDVVFLLDATGSMGDEIAVIKTKIREMISDIALGEPPPDVRFGIVAYRDRGDEYVTRAYPLTRNIDQIVDDLHAIEATGGGDYPESLNEGLHVALDQMSWDRSPEAARLVFLIADAPPHLDYAQDFDYREEAEIAARDHIVVHAIGASGLDEAGEEAFRHIATRTRGEFQWLAYETRHLAEDGEEIIVRVEGREVVYTKGDSIWETAGGGVPGGLERLFGTGETLDATTVGEGGGPGAEATTSTNLENLITSAIKRAAEETGVEYGVGASAVQPSSWGRVKARSAR